MPRRPRQLGLPRTSTWGGARSGAGRSCPRIGARSSSTVLAPSTAQHSRCMSRCGREPAFPRCGWSAPSWPFGTQSRARRLHGSASCISRRKAITFTCSSRPTIRPPFRRESALSRRVARGINRAVSRRGAVWADRYHARALRTPREVRAGLVYVLQNWKKHIRNARGLDGRSSASWFDGWMDEPARPTGPAPVVHAQTWLAAIGWRRCAGGALRRDEEPRR